jgi:hypothetical protein
VNTERQDTLGEDLLRRICGEFLEMPGLQLTRPQARRLLALDEETCTRILDLLVEIKFLCLTDLDTYARLTEGPVAFTSLTVAKAKMDCYPLLR